jgi:maleate isomerase
MLALNEVLASTQVKQLGFVTPYLDEVQDRILANYGALGIACRGERHLGLQDNFSFSEVTRQQIIDMTRMVARQAPQAITVICTNLNAAWLVDDLEQEVGIPIYDTIATVIWKSLILAGVDPSRVTGWGTLFRKAA